MPLCTIVLTVYMGPALFWIDRVHVSSGQRRGSYWRSWMQQLQVPDITLLSSRKLFAPDLDSRLVSPRPRPRPRLAYPRPSPRLWGSKTKTKTLRFKTKTKTLMSKTKTKTETQDLYDQYWKSMTGMDCDKQKDWKSHGKQKIPAYW